MVIADLMAALGVVVAGAGLAGAFVLGFTLCDARRRMHRRASADLE